MEAIKLTPLELILGILAIVSIAVVLGGAVVSRNWATINQKSAELNQNIELKDSIERFILGTVPKETAEEYAKAFSKVIDLLTSTVLKLPNEDAKSAITSLKMFLNTVTDGQPNIAEAELLPEGLIRVSGITTEEFKAAWEEIKKKKGEGGDPPGGTVG